MKSGFPTASEYFTKFDIKESHVVKFQHQNGVQELTLIVCTDAAHNFEKMTPEERMGISIKSPYVDVHKLVFKGVTGYRRENPISPKFRDREEFEETSGDGIILVLYGVENTKHKEKYEFSAVLSGFGEITFFYSELSVEFKKVIEKLDCQNWNVDRLYFDQETGKVDHIPQLFDESEISVGDTVLLKSGGPKMTIESINKVNGKLLAECTWFDNGKRKNKDIFSFDMLTFTHGSMYKKAHGQTHHK